MYKLDSHHLLSNFKRTTSYLLVFILLFISTTIWPSEAKADIASDLVAYWSFDDGSGTTASDSSGNGYTATLENGAAWTTGRKGGAVDLDGTDDWIDLSNGGTNNLGVSGAMTISFWFWADNDDSGSYFMDNRTSGSWWFIKEYTGGSSCLNYSNNICFEDRVFAKDFNWNPGQWTHLVVTDDTSTARIYINGQLVATGTGESATISTSLRIGTRYTNVNYFAGMFDEVRVYDRALSSSDVSELYFTDSAGGPSGQTTIKNSALFEQSLTITGAISKGSGTFVIDHPLDPANKLLFHSFVESPDVKNIYDGIVTLDDNGEATVKLPDYFEALNGDYRYQYSAYGEPAPGLYIKQEIQNNEFTIAGGPANARVSWQVTGIRHDPYILANPIIPEVDKGPDQLVDKGEYLYSPR